MKASQTTAVFFAMAVLAGAAFLLFAGAAAPLDRALAQRPAGAPAGAQGAPPAAAARQPANLSKPMPLFTVKNAAMKLANCNDGSPAAFYFQPGTSGAEKKWVIFFQGGGGCASDQACTGRWATQRELMTSVGLSRQLAGDGIISTDEKVNPDFAHFAHVLIHYCSSDTYAGDATHAFAGQTFQFRGHRIVDAVLDDLMDKTVVGATTLRDATEVLVVGSSAGAFGMENNIDRIAARLAPAKVKAIADSDWIPPIDTYAPGIFEAAFYRPQAMAYYKAEPDESCVKANPTHAGDCLLSSFLFPYIATPMFVYADQRDPVLLSTLGIMGAPQNAAERAYVQKFGQGVRDGLAKVPAAFSASLARHTALQNDAWQSVRIEGQTLQQTVGNWYFGRKGPVKLILQP